MDIRTLLAQVADKMIDVVVPMKDSHLSVLGAERLARAEEDYDVAEPMGEYPDLPNVTAGVAAAPPSGSAGGHPTTFARTDRVCGILGRHQIGIQTDATKIRQGLAYLCDCGQAFSLQAEHVLHVADLVVADLDAST